MANRVLALCVSLLLVLTGCHSGSSSANNSSRKSGVPPWERVPWEGMTPEERDRTAVAELLKSEKFSGPRCRWLKHGGGIYAWPQETHIYKAAHEVGYIEMEQTGTGNRIGRPEPFWRIRLTDAGKAASADCPPVSRSEDWGVPVSRRRLISAKYIGEGKNYSGITMYEVEYEWVPTEVGEKVKEHLTDHMKVEEGKYRTQAWLKKTPGGWYVDAVHDLGAARLD